MDTPRPFPVCYPCPSVRRRMCGPLPGRTVEVFMPGRPIRTFTVLPHLPDRLRPLRDLAYNLWWCWHHDAVALFRRIDPDLFEAVENSPVKMLGAAPQNRFEQLL